MSDDEDDLEIVETSIITMNSSEPDVDDLRFQLRNEERRLKELFPHVKSIYEMDFKELSAGKTIIDREPKDLYQDDLLKEFCTLLSCRS